MSALAGHFSIHFRELRNRVLASFLAVLVATLIAYAFSEHLVRFLMAPLITGHPNLAKLVYTNLTEAFVSYLKISLLAGLIVGFPVCCYQLWMFIAPGLHSHERRMARTVVFWATSLFAGGVVFAYLVVMPEMLSFLLSFADDQLEPLLRLDAYLTFVARTSLAFGLAFEVPFLMVMAAKAGIVSKGYFVRQRKYFYIAILILSFLLTAGDVLSAILLAVPLFGLYEAGIIFSRPFKGKLKTEG
ncbi:twin-arginine translocase subunit TatC [Thiovibrio frasassiensis]|uniref:Sec-independent protein translocase protein TatC n=1 Tax=Thiovibrio frasassiensis TaxID=2984131 RepID=A0A9X4RKS2_9BACT|nr:twin-arginine translocase subunit TatC [Thiovibrio frasassiensis]MDG4474830.1 twin-arginine translocase subunit TatC [Thiovibrio frasassiensis]